MIRVPHPTHIVLHVYMYSKDGPAPYFVTRCRANRHHNTFFPIVDSPVPVSIPKDESWIAKFDKKSVCDVKKNVVAVLTGHLWPKQLAMCRVGYLAPRHLSC